MDISNIRKRNRLKVQRFRSRIRLHYDFVRYKSIPKTSLFVLATGRSGSHLLVSYLNSLPDVTMRGEVLNERQPGGIGPCTVQRLHKPIRMSTLRHPTSIGGVKFLLEQVRNKGLVLSELRNHCPEVKFLVLYRKSLGEQFVSQRISKKTKEFNRLKGQLVTHETVLVDSEKFIKFCQRQRQRYDDLRADQFVMDNSLWMSYEELTESKESLFKEKVCPFLEVPYSPLTTMLIRQNRQRLSDKVENYAQLEPLFTSSETRLDYDY